jgi:hypothetical protein
MSDDMKIAGKRTVKDWQDFKKAVFRGSGVYLIALGS